MKLSREHFERLMVEQMDLLYRVARRLTANADQAADLVQETLLRALRAYQSFDLQEHGIRPWLVRIMRNLHLTRSQREQRQPVALETASLETVPREHAGEVMPGGWEAMDERLVRALNELPKDYQVVLMLWAVEEFSYKEIAEALDVPIGTVMSRLHRARHRLAELVRDLAVEQGVIRE